MSPEDPTDKLVVHVVARAVAARTDVVFGVAGDGNIQLAAELVRLGVRWVAARHEAGAVAMADGYARRSGRVGVASVTHGPGVTNAATSLTAARLARTPLVLLAGNTPRTTRHHGQDIDQAPLHAATAGRYLPLRLPATAEEDVALAFRVAVVDRGPLVLDLPTDLLNEAAPAATTPVPPWELPADVPVAPRQEDVDAVVTMFERAKRPLLLAGRGAAAARSALVGLADRSGALTGTTLLGQGIFAERPAGLGVIGGFSTVSTKKNLDSVDLVLAFGASLNRYTTINGRLCPAAAWVQVDRSRSAFGETVRLDRAVVADCHLMADALLERLPLLDRPALELEATDPVPPGRSTGRAPTGLDPREVLLEVNRRVDPGRNLVAGIGHYSGWAALLVEVADPANLVLPWQLGSVGQALGVAAGVAVATPGSVTLLIEGDGGLLMNPAELDTLARERLPVLVVVLDDAAYGAELHLLRKMGLSDDLALFPRRDLAGLARSMGIRAATATTPAQLDGALSELLRLDGPALLHVHTDSEIVHDEVFSALEG